MSDIEPILEGEIVPKEPNWTMVMVYGIIADAMVILPVLFYMIFDGVSQNSKHHQTMVNMITSSWMPFAIVWIIVLAQDTEVARTALTGALEMAALGPFALMWVGYMAFLMSAQASGVLGSTANIVWAIVYPFLNIGLIILHWVISPEIYKWIDHGVVPQKDKAPKDEGAQPDDDENFEGESAEDAETF